jgi:hypothetical protein
VLVVDVTLVADDDDGEKIVFADVIDVELLFDDVINWSFVAFKKFTLTPFVRLLMFAGMFFESIVSSSSPPPGSSVKEKIK